MTFAVHWIRAEIQDYIVRNLRMVKVATTKNQRKLFFNLRQLKKSDRALTSAEAAEIAQTLDVKPEEVFEMEKRLSGADLPLDGGQDADGAETDRPVPADWLADEREGPAEALETKDRERMAREGLRKALSALDPRARRVSQARWLNEDADGNVTTTTLKELAEELGVSAERVRQIEKRALTEMREYLTKNPG